MPKTKPAPAKRLRKPFTPLPPRNIKVKICVDFSSYPDNTLLGPTYSQSGFVFAQLLPTPVMFANATAGQIGLQFPDAGLEIKLPAPSGRVSLLIGTFGGPVKLQTFRGASPISAQTIDTANAFANLVVSAPVPVSRLVFKGGHNEGILVRICGDYTLVA